MVGASLWRGVWVERPGAAREAHGARPSRRAAHRALAPTPAHPHAALTHANPLHPMSTQGGPPAVCARARLVRARGDHQLQGWVAVRVGGWIGRCGKVRWDRSASIRPFHSIQIPPPADKKPYDAFREHFPDGTAPDVCIEAGARQRASGGRAGQGMRAGRGRRPHVKAGGGGVDAHQQQYVRLEQARRCCVLGEPVLLSCSPLAPPPPSPPGSRSGHALHHLLAALVRDRGAICLLLQPLWLLLPR